MINLRSNYPSLHQETFLFTKFLTNHLQPEALSQQPVPINPEEYFTLLERYLQVPASLLTHTSNIIDCNSGTQAIFTLLFALQDTNKSIGVEDFTYSGLKTTAGHLQYQLFTVDCDEEGLLPEAVKAAIEQGVKLFYVQPTIHNPTCRVMSQQRRQDIANIISGTGAILMEDDAYRFLHPQPPSSFLQLLPEQTIHIASLAKPFNSFIQTCFVIYPKPIPANFPEVIDKAGGTRSTLFIQFAKYLLQGEDLFTLLKAKQQNAQQIQSIILPLLSGLHYQTQPTSCHVWISLPAGQDSLAVVGKLAKKQIAVTGSHECSATGNTRFIRMALSAEKNITILQNALLEVRQLLLFEE